MKCVVGYEATPQGIDAINLAVDIARAMNMDLEIVLVLRRHDIFSHEYPPTGTVDDVLLTQAFRWLHGALDQIPEDVNARAHVYSGTSTAEGLSRAAEDVAAGMIVVGGASSSPFKRHRLGTIAQDLLFGATVPIALSPRGYLRTPINRINCAVGTRPGAGSLVETGIVLSKRSQLPLRLVALMSEEEGADARQQAIDNAHAVVARVMKDEPAPEFDIEVSASNLSSVDFNPGDLMFVGSSRVAEKQTVFAGSVAMRLLKTLSIPLVVVPREYHMKQVDT